MMNLQNNPKSKWLSSGGKIKQVVRLQNINDPGGGDRAITVRQKVILIVNGFMIFGYYEQYILINKGYNDHNIFSCHLFRLSTFHFSF